MTSYLGFGLKREDSSFEQVPSVSEWSVSVLMDGDAK